MGTRSFIAKKTKAGYKAIYCHWDGYPEKPGVGWELKTHYKDPKKIDKLITLGDISSLRSNIGRKHKFDNYKLAQKKNYTTAYHRDRNETWKDVKPKIYKTLSELKKAAANYDAEYLYIYNKGVWRVTKI